MNPNQQGKYSVAVSLFVFQWIPNLEMALQNVYRVMAPGGKLLAIQSFKMSDSYFSNLPKLTSKPKWKKMLDQVNILHKNSKFTIILVVYTVKMH